MIARHIVRAAEPEINLWFQDHVRERLAKMYGGEDKIPPVAARIQRGMIGTPPAFEGKAILRGAMLYFVPGEMQRKADTIWHRMAQAVLPRAAHADIVPPASRGHGLTPATNHKDCPPNAGDTV